MRFDQCVCGTSTTLTGTLTLAATPTPPGGVDFDVWARALGFGNSAALLVEYEIIEYTSTSFATAKQSERGIGTLTLGASAGIANCTLARTTIDISLTGMSTPPATVSLKPAAGISIGTAANTLVMVSPSSFSLKELHPYYESTLGDANWGVSPDNQGAAGNNVSGNWPTSAIDWLLPFSWSAPMLVKRLTVRATAFTSVTGTPVLFARLYAFATNGRPGKLLFDFTPTTGVTVAATGLVTTGAVGNGFMLTPGDYFLDLALTGLTGGTINFRAPNSPNVSPAQARLGMNNGASSVYATATGATAGAGPDPANTTSYGLVAISNVAPPCFGLAPA